jgi:methylthioribose-1-phosphate isomerase
MRVNGKDYKTVWMLGNSVFMIDQNQLPFRFKIYEAKSYKDICIAIKTMTVRGAGAIGAAAGYAMALAFMESSNKGMTSLIKAKSDIENTRPTARNLFYAVEKVFAAGQHSVENAIKEAAMLAEEDSETSKKIGEFGQELILNGYNLETHCNAGWLAFVDYGTAFSPIYFAHKAGRKIFVYVDETRPRSQGARLTAWELQNENIPHSIISDNTTAYLMSKGKVDMFIAGADRIAANGDVANKIGTFEKAIIAKEFNVPFYIAAPSSTFDPECKTGKDIVIEERSEDEGLYQSGLTADGRIEKVLVCSPGSHYYNPAFDITPAKYITGIITENGIISPGSKL